RYWKLAMSSNEQGKKKAGQDGSSFANRLYDCLVSGIIILDRNHQIETITPEAAQMLGLDSAKAPGRAAHILPEALQGIVRDTSASDRPITNRQLTLDSARSGSLGFRVTAQPLRLGGMELVINEMTSSGVIDQHIQQLDRLASIGTLSAGMAHEIRNALVAG